MWDHKSIDKKKWRREDVSEKYKSSLLHDVTSLIVKMSRERDVHRAARRLVIITSRKY